MRYTSNLGSHFAHRITLEGLGDETLAQSLSTARVDLDPHQVDADLRKLRLLDAARTLEDLRNPPGNRLEALKGDRAGQMRIRIYEQWRICFHWADHDALDVEITDYH
jgi:proteic killer suppression protein